jgi:hypothetical protein
LNCLLFDAPPLGQDGFTAPEVDVCRGQVADALVVAVVVVVVDEGGERIEELAMSLFSAGYDSEGTRAV